MTCLKLTLVKALQDKNSQIDFFLNAALEKNGTLCMQSIKEKFQTYVIHIIICLKIFRENKSLNQVGGKLTKN